MSEIPYARLEAVLLDAGNTLVSMNFEWIREVLAALGLPIEVPALIRAEAAARPAVSRALASRGSTETRGAFVFYLERTLAGLETAPAGRERGALAERLAAALRAPPPGTRLWGRVLAGVPEALEALREQGLRLVVVSNSDGSVEAQLEESGLARHLDGVIDSHRVGAEKPDPAIFAHGLAAAGCSPERALHVGDIYSADVVGARAAGVHAALLDPFGDWGEVDCERFASLTELSARLRAARSGRRR